MITKEQINEHCRFRYRGGDPFSGLLYARLDRDYQAEDLDYILPAGTIVQVELYTVYDGSLYLNGRVVDGSFPYDAATLLEDEE